MALLPHEVWPELFGTPTRSLREHPVPVREEAIRAIGTRSLAIDIYIYTQFGAGFALVKHLKPVENCARDLS